MAEPVVSIAVALRSLARILKITPASYEDLLSTAARRQLHKKHTFVACLLLTATVWLAGCAGVSVKSAWQSGVPHDQTFARVLIVGVSPNYNVRCAFESVFASQLRSASTTVFSSCSAMNSAEPLTRENIERVVASVHADAVLATRLVSLNSGQQVGGSSDTRGDRALQVDGFWLRRIRHAGDHRRVPNGAAAYEDHELDSRGDEALRDARRDTALHARHRDEVPRNRFN